VFPTKVLFVRRRPFHMPRLPGPVDHTFLQRVPELTAPANRLRFHVPTAARSAACSPPISCAERAAVQLRPASSCLTGWMLLRQLCRNFREQSSCDAPTRTPTCAPNATSVQSRITHARTFPGKATGVQNAATTQATSLVGAEWDGNFAVSV